MCNSAVINAESTSLFNIGTVFRTKKWGKDNVIVWFLDVKESTCSDMPECVFTAIF